MKKSIYVLTVFAALAGFVIVNLSADIENPESDLIFSHESHISQHDADCATCHPNAATSTSGTDDLLPKEETCNQCHDKKDTKCEFCHKSPDKPVLLPRVKDFSSKFNHKAHIDKGAKCETCHSGISKKTSVAGMHLPDMDKCMTCHTTPETLAGCDKCHNEGDELKPRDHTSLWKANHGNFAESKSSNCMSCHTESYCMDCHKGENLANQSHPPNFIMTHAISYTMRESNCMSCHNDMQYCIECHTQVNYIKPMSHTSPNWIATHRTEAKPSRDLCVVCHTANDNTCARCH